jgi:hypothetical protein
MLAITTLIPLILFVALIVAAALHGLAAGGHFPRGSKLSSIEPFVLFGSMVTVIVCLVAGIAAALRLLPWYAAIIGGGIAVLAAPPALQWVPDRFVDGQGALLACAGASAVLAILLISLALAV